jgi:hypothetical protein
MVTYDVAFANLSKSAFVTGVASIQNPPTDTRCTGNASGIPQFSHPIQKSPPGIHTIPAGAGPGAGDVLTDGVRLAVSSATLEAA